MAINALTAQNGCISKGVIRYFSMPNYALFLFSKSKKGGIEQMLEKKLIVETIGEPDVFVLDNVEQGILLETLFERISKLTTRK